MFEKIARPSSTAATIVAKFNNPFVAILILAAFLSVLTHMRIGMQVIIEDYVHTDVRKIALLMANTLRSACLANGLPRPAF